MRGMEMRDYVNSPPEERNGTERTGETGRCDAVPPSGLKVYRLVGVSFGLLCLLQSTLNISLRLQAKSDQPGNITSTSAGHDLAAERHRLIEQRDQLQTRYDDCIHDLKGGTADNRLVERFNALTRDRDKLETVVSRQANEMKALREERDRLLKRMAEEQSIPGCPVGWIPYLSSCYLLYSDQKTWKEARQDCVMKGSHLITINSIEEQVILLHLLTNSANSAWIGLTARFTDQAWTWADGSPLTVRYWEALQVGLRHIAKFSEDCVYAAKSSAAWNVADCGESHGWICEKELDLSSGSTRA